VQSLNDIQRQAVEQRNASYTGSQTYILAQIKAQDEAWIAASVNDPFIQRIISGNLNSSAEQLTDLLSDFPEHTEFILTDRYGATIAATGHLSDYYQGDEEWWQRAWNDGQGAFYISEPEYDESSETTAMLLAIPITGHDTAEPIGVLRSTLNVDSLYAFLAEQVTGETGHSVLFDSNGEVLFDPRADEEASAGLPLELRQEFIGEEAHFDVENDQHGHEMIFGHASFVPVEEEGEAHGHALYYTELEEQIVDTVAELRWATVFRQETEEAFAPVAQITRTILITSLIVIALAVAASAFLGQLLSNPVVRLTAVAEDVAGGNLNARAKVETGDEIGTLATTFNEMTSQLQETLQGLERRVAERTQNLVLAADVGRSVSQVRELEVMLQDACELIRKEFDLYYVQVYLTNPNQTALQLQAGTGEVGAQLRERGHSLQLNTGSINGRAAVEKRTVVIADTAESTVFRPNPLLPDTRGEMAVPLIVGDQVVGVLDMQSQYPGTLNEEVLPSFEALAGQLAIAVQNARLVAETEEARAEVEAQARRLVRTVWGDYMDAIHQPEQLGFAFDRKEVTPLTVTDTAQLPGADQAISAPISLTGEALGSLVVEIDEENQNEQTVELVNVVASQVAQQLENLRLLDNAERFRIEAEQAARRQTQAGWQEYIESRTADSLGYLYDLKKVRPHSNGQEDADALTLPIKAREETVGKLSIQGLSQDDKESYELASAVAERLGTIIENLRLSEQTKQSLAFTDELFSISQSVNEAASENEMIEALARPSAEAGAVGANLMYLDLDSAGNPEWAEIVADWRHEGEAPIPVGTRFYLPELPFSKLWVADPDNPLFISDVQTDDRVDDATRVAMEQGGSRALAIVPLTRGQERVGLITFTWDQPHEFSQNEQETCRAIIGLASPAVHSRRLFEQTQMQADREAMLNVINQKIQSATSVEAVLQIAARELGHALDAPMTIAQLSMDNQDS